jgi:hypothetical protein
MKRLVWLFLAVFCTALAQVQPVDLSATKPEACCCGDASCGCGMPDCGLPPAQSSVTFTAERPTSEFRQQARRVTARLPHAALRFYLSLVEPAVVTTALRAPVKAAPAASVPLFQAHCSFLI